MKFFKYPKKFRDNEFNAIKLMDDSGCKLQELDLLINVERRLLNILGCSPRSHVLFKALRLKRKLEQGLEGITGFQSSLGYPL